MSKGVELVLDRFIFESAPLGILAEKEASPASYARLWMLWTARRILYREVSIYSNCYYLSLNLTKWREVFIADDLVI